MAWDDAVNHGGGFIGGNLEWGEATMVDGTVEIPTRLQKIESATITPKADPERAHSYWCDKVITNGAVTVQDLSGTGSEVVNYFFVGRQ